MAVAGIIVASFGFVGDVADGRWRASAGWADTVSFSQDRLSQGQFRILWLGDASVLPLDPVQIDPTLSFTLTRNGPGDARAVLRAKESSADRVISRAVRVAIAGDTSRLGRMLAPPGVRYVAIALRNGPHGEVGREPPGVVSAVSAQLDLARLGSQPGLVLFENQSWAPARAALQRRSVPSGAVDPLRSAAATDLAGASPLRGTPTAAGTTLLAEAFDAGWSATTAGTVLPHTRVSDTRTDGRRRRAARLRSRTMARRSAICWSCSRSRFWVVAIAGGRGRRRGNRVRARRDREREREERTRGQTLDDFFVDVSDDDFWARQ